MNGNNMWGNSHGSKLVALGQPILHNKCGMGKFNLRSGFEKI